MVAILIAARFFSGFFIAFGLSLIFPFCSIPLMLTGSCAIGFGFVLFSIET